MHPSLADHEAKLAEIRKRAKSRTSAEAAADGERQDYDFEDAQDRWWHTQLAQLVRDLKTFTDPKSGGLYSSGISAKHGWGILRRAEFARRIEERSVSGPEARRLWEAATLAVAKSEKYGGLKLTPQLGLLPIGEDPESHLWEFAHLQTGEPAHRGDDGRLEIEEPMGLVFVLVPSGTFWMGAQRNDKDEPNYDPEARAEEAPVREVALSPFFLSKYEMTQGQWERFAGQDPSYFGPSNYALSWNRGSRPWSSVYPVESVSWLECSALIQRLGLSLPTEAQWEYGCRAGTHTAYWSGAAKETLSDTANIADAYAKAHGGDVWAVLQETWDDGNTCKAAVCSYRANPFGLHDMHGNVSEWCRDFYSRYTAEAREGDGERAATGSANHICRGGGYFDNALIARAAMRQNLPADTHSDGIGVRPALALKP